MISERRSPVIQSLDRGLQLLEILSMTEKPSGLTDLSEMLGVDRSTVHRLLATLQQRGYVQQDPDSKRYCLGLRVVELSRLVIDRLSLRVIARPYLKQLVTQTGESANLVVMAGHRCICLDHEPSPSALAVTNEIGTPFAPHATASGKVLLAALPEPEQLRASNADSLPAFTPRTITDLPTLSLHLEAVSQQGYAVDDEERFVGARCLAAPIHDHSGRVAAAISISGPASRITLERVPSLIDSVQNAARDISRDMGHTCSRECDYGHP